MVFNVTLNCFQHGLAGVSELGYLFRLPLRVKVSRESVSPISLPVSPSSVPSLPCCHLKTLIFKPREPSL